MSSIPRRSPNYQEVDGFRIPGYFSADAFRSGLAYKPRPDDVMIVTYPKCGTTWMQNIVACIFNDGEPFKSSLEFLNQTPFLERSGAKAAETMRRPGAIKVHLPFHLIPYSTETKYIFVARNPKDCCVSFYHHTKSIPGYNFSDGEFDDYFELFIHGEVDFGDYFDTLLSWYEHRNDANVLFLTYEELKQDPHKYVLETAAFIGSEYGDRLLKDPQLLDKIVEHSSFHYMRETMEKHIVELSSCPAELILNNPDIPDSIKTIYKTKDSVFSPGAVSAALVRKGVVGDWRNFFSKEQSEQLDAKFRERTRGTDILKLWKDYM